MRCGWIFFHMWIQKWSSSTYWKLFPNYSALINLSVHICVRWFLNVYFIGLFADSCMNATLCSKFWFREWKYSSFSLFFIILDMSTTCISIYILESVCYSHKKKEEKKTAGILSDTVLNPYRLIWMNWHLFHSLINKQSILLHMCHFLKFFKKFSV